MLRHSFLFRRCLHSAKMACRRSSAGGRYVHSSAFVMGMVQKRVEIEVSWDSAMIASTWVERTMPVMALDASNLTFSCLPVEVADSRGSQAVAAYSSILRTIAM